MVPHCILDESGEPGLPAPLQMLLPWAQPAE